MAAGVVAESGLTCSVDFHRGDVLALEPAEYTDVDLLSCCVMGHDFWPRERRPPPSPRPSDPPGGPPRGPGLH